MLKNKIYSIGCFLFTFLWKHDSYNIFIVLFLLNQLNETIDNSLMRVSLYPFLVYPYPYFIYFVCNFYIIILYKLIDRIFTIYFSR